MTNNTYDRMLAEMPAGLDRATLRVLSFHTGKKNALGRDLLVAGIHLEGFDVSERQVRQCIHDLRRKGYLICSAPGEEGGYFMAANWEEFEEFCQRELHPKAVNMLETESAMKEAARKQFGDAVQLGML